MLAASRSTFWLIRPCSVRYSISQLHSLCSHIIGQLWQIDISTVNARLRYAACDGLPAELDNTEASHGAFHDRSMGERGCRTVLTTSCLQQLCSRRSSIPLGIYDTFGHRGSDTTFELTGFILHLVLPPEHTTRKLSTLEIDAGSVLH